MIFVRLTRLKKSLLTRASVIGGITKLDIRVFLQSCSPPSFYTFLSAYIKLNLWQGAFNNNNNNF